MGRTGDSRRFAKRSSLPRRSPYSTRLPLSTPPAIHAGFRAPVFTELLEKEAEDARDTAETIIGGREGCSASVVRGKPVDVLRRERDELQATLVALGGRRSSRFLGVMLGDTGTELVHDAACSSLLACPADGPWRPRKIVVGFDGSTYSRAALRSAEELAEANGGTVEVLSATGGKSIERDACLGRSGADLGSYGSGWRPRRALAHGRPRRGRVARRPRHADDRQCQRARRASSPLHRPHRARAGGKQR